MCFNLLQSLFFSSANCYICGQWESPQVGSHIMTPPGFDTLFYSSYYRSSVKLVFQGIPSHFREKPHLKTTM